MSNIAREMEKLSDDFGIDKKRSIGEVAKELDLEPHIIRFWEENFPQINPQTGRGGRRYYYNRQLKILKRIKKFLYEDGYTIAGLQKLLKKRKPDSYKEEDLDIIAFSHENLSKNDNSSISLEHFINPQIDLLNQHNDKPASVDCVSLEQKEEVSDLLQNIRKNITELKILFKN